MSIQENAKMIDEMLQDQDIVKIARKASIKFINQLNEDEIYTCIINALWKAIKKYDPNFGSKFTTYLYNGVIMECLTQQKFNSNLKRHSQIQSVQDKKSLIPTVDIIDEISKCDDPIIIYDYFFNNKSIKEIAKENNVCGETIRLKIKKNLKKIKTNYI